MHDDDPVMGLVGVRCALLMSDGTRLEGELSAAAPTWWTIQGDEGQILVNPAHIAAVAASGELPAKPVTRRGRASTSTSPGRPWDDRELKQLSDGYLDGETDKEIAARFERTPAVIRQLRQGFEVARGNLDADTVGEIAASWVSRWQSVLRG
ncbi:MAG: hypothetical protein PF961_23850 [Planctomycetota bacterium]|jgi:hypothetical protein|nr:hypothetical protein [Planctomycetota bacterium]